MVGLVLMREVPVEPSDPGHEPSHPIRRVPRHALVRAAILALIVLAGFAVLRWSPMSRFLTKEAILSTLDHLRGVWWSPAALIAGYVLLSPVGFPPSPLMVAGGVIFGPVYGAVYNLIGIFLGAASTYYLGRHLGRDLVLHLAGKQMKRVERALTRRGGVWSLAGVRFLPLPFALVNYAAALAGIRPGLFLGSTLLGLSMSVPIFTYFSWAIARAATGDRSGVYVQLAVAIALLLSMTLVPRILAARKRRERYRQIRGKRSERPPAGPV
ncbi:MAG TPA: VTT domain-containing protein [Thermoanaerobaculia bacterium]|nr:VTT domain-containing protein [Thermoanaerobaculia bacterium]